MWFCFPIFLPALLEAAWKQKPVHRFPRQWVWQLLFKYVIPYPSPYPQDITISQATHCMVLCILIWHASYRFISVIIRMDYEMGEATVFIYAGGNAQAMFAINIECISWVSIEELFGIFAKDKIGIISRGYLLVILESILFWMSDSHFNHIFFLFRREIIHFRSKLVVNVQCQSVSKLLILMRSNQVRHLTARSSPYSTIINTMGHCIFFGLPALVPFAIQYK